VSAASETPAAAVQDGIMASQAEVAGAGTQWVAKTFGSALTAKTKVMGGKPPFSFIYGGKLSTEFLEEWDLKAEKEDSVDRLQQKFTWSDAKTGLRVTAVVSTFARYPATDWVLYFENAGAQDTPILEDVQALDLKLMAESPAVLHQLAGDNCSAGSFTPIDTQIEAGKSVRMAPGGGRSSNGTFPWFNFEYGGDGGQAVSPGGQGRPPHSTQGVIAAIGWTGQWAASLERAADGSTRMRAGMERTKLVLHPGERIRSPRILLMPWQGDLTAAHNRFRRLMLFHYVPKQDGRPVLLPAFLQCYDRYNGHPTWPTEAGQISAAKIAKDVGCEFLWLDAAWFPGRFPNGVGNWFTHEKFPNGLKPVSDACHQLGLKFTVWFEPERVGKGTEIAKEHPEFVHGGANGGLFKLDDPAARRWLTDLLLKRIDEYGMDWYRNDFNMDPLDSWRKNDAAGTEAGTTPAGTPALPRQGMTEIRYIEGLYAMWDEFRAKHPNLVIDNCASGGRRIDLEMCMRSVPLWQSDTSCVRGAEDAHQAQSCALSLYVPLHTPCSWNATPYEIRSTATAGLVTQLPILEPGFSVEQARPILEEGKANRKFWYGDLYPLTPVSVNPDQYLAFEFFRPDLSEGIVLAFRRARCTDRDLVLNLKGLDAAKKYWVWSQDGSISAAVCSGEELMNKGVVLRIPGPRASEIICVRDESQGKPGDLRPPGNFNLKKVQTSADLFATSVQLDWEPSARAKRYRVLISETVDFAKLLAEQGTTETTANIGGLPEGKQLYGKVEAYSKGSWVNNDDGHWQFTAPALLSRKGITFACDLQWTKATVGAEQQVHRETNLKGNPIMIDGKNYPKSLWTHSFNDKTPADIVFQTNGKFATFEATVGIDDLGEHGSVQFQVLADGEQKLQTPVIRPKQTRAIKADVSGAKEVTLRVLNGGDGYGWDHAVWGTAVFREK
jgi:alpha-galactosidase